MSTLDYSTNGAEQDEEVFVSPPILDPDGDDQTIIDVELKHILGFLGGLTLAGCVIAVMWEWANHKFKARRIDSIANATATVAQSLATLVVETSKIASQIEFETGDE